MAGRRTTFNPADLSKLSEDDRIAVMKMVKEGEMSVEEAYQKAKSQAEDSAQNTITRNLMKLAGGGKGGFNRRGAMRKNRGRLLLDITIQKASAFCVLSFDIKEGRDLMAMNANGTSDPYCKIYLLNGSDVKGSKSTKKKTCVRKNTSNPAWNEHFQWEIRTGSDLENTRLHISVWDDHGMLRKNKFMGSMSFSLEELFEAESPFTSGWYRLLDEVKGNFQNIPWRNKKKEEDVGGGKEAPLPPTPRSTIVGRPLPSTPGAAAVPTSGPSAPATPAQQKQATLAPKKPPTDRKPTIGDFGGVKEDSFTYLKVLGQGSFGKVFLAEHKGTQEVFAIKALRKEAVIEDDDVDCTMVERRVLALGSGCHFLTNLCATFQTSSRLYFVMEFINGGDLMFHIQKQKRFGLDQCVFYTAEICTGLWFLHKNGVIYRDLKLDNVMLDRDGHIKIADFGMCKENMWGAATTTTFCGTPGYLAPEIIKEQPYGNSVDWWSLGVLVFEMLVGDSPFEGDDEDELFEAILHSKLEFPAKLAPAAKAILEGFLSRDVPVRLGCSRTGQRDIQSHPFFASIDWVKLENRQIEPPFKPAISSAKEANNFDPEFTGTDPKLSPPNMRAIANIDQEVFRGFSFINKLWGKTDGESAAPEEVAEAKQESIRKPALSDHTWYRPDLPRDEAMRLLHGKPAGTFFVRESSSQPGCYAIAMVTEPGKVWNGLVTPSVTADGQVLYKLFVKQKFSSLPELIDYYCLYPVTTDAKGEKLKLKKPE